MYVCALFGKCCCDGEILDSNKFVINLLNQFGVHNFSY